MIELVPLLLSCAATVHPDTVKDVAWVESRMNPYAIGVVGGDGLVAKSKEDALQKVGQLEEAGKNYSVGLMQINKSNFEKYGMTAEKLFDACANLSVFEKIITDCYVRGKTLQRALSCYYSGNFETGTRKEKSFSDSSYVQRVAYAGEISYAVPSTRSDKAKQVLNDRKAKTEKKPEWVMVVYPDGVLKGSMMAVEENPTKILQDGEK